MKDCKHENITLDDLGKHLDTYLGARCPKCKEFLYYEEMMEIGYKLVKVDSNET